MSVWERSEIERKITDILRETPYQEAHHFGRPYLSAYQLAIAVDRRWPDVRNALDNPPVGGRGIGTRNSLAQYLARELSRRIRSGELTAIEGAFLSDEDLVELVYVETDGQRVTSLTGSGYDLSLFRLRSAS
ncbi:MAG TPA: hypothetical protein VFB06_26860 [Streptosporangiaceae bacterium]|nr:hypothetical protein [Streptosporangiaceae bacterium]